MQINKSSYRSFGKVVLTQANSAKTWPAEDMPIGRKLRPYLATLQDSVQPKEIVFQDGCVLFVLLCEATTS